MWLALALCSSLLLGFYDIAKKHALRENAPYEVLVFATIIGSAPFILNLLFPALFGNAALAGAGHPLVFAKAALMAASWYLTFQALKHLPLSIAAPIRSSAPGWTILGAVCLMGERLVALQWIGISLILVSLIGLAWVGKKEAIHFTRDRRVGFAFMGMLLGAASALYDKYLLTSIPPLPLQTWVYFYLDCILIGFWLWVTRFRPLSEARKRGFVWRHSIAVIGITLAIADFTYFHALAVPGALISLISVIRRSNVVVSFLLGSILFHEKFRRQKALMILGILLGIVAIAWAK